MTKSECIEPPEISLLGVFGSRMVSLFLALFAFRPRTYVDPLSK